MALSKAKMSLLTALFVVAFAALIFFALRNKGPQNTARGPGAAPAASPFADVPESEIPGRYKWIDRGQASSIELLSDHTFMNKEGNIFPMYRWELTPQGLWLRFAAGSQIFTNVEGPGVYTRTTSNGNIIRIEKQAASTGADWMPSARPGLTAAVLSNYIVGSLLLTGLEQTNGLEVVNTAGDGAIFPTTRDEVECSQLFRKPNRPEAYLYMRIAPELKEPPFTNAAVLVEYFDSRPADPRTGFISLQYDGPSEAYTRLEQRVRLTGTEKWKELIFFIENPRFQNRLNSGGDFRLCTVNPELGVRSVKLAKNIP